MGQEDIQITNSKAQVATSADKKNPMEVVLIVARIGLGAMLVWSSLPKLRFPYEFLANVYQFELTSPRVGMMVSIVAPWCELFLGVALLLGVCVAGALMGTAAMMAVFTAVQSIAIANKLDITCGCFSMYSLDTISGWTVARTGLLLLVTVAAYMCWLVLEIRKSKTAAAAECPAT